MLKEDSPTQKCAVPVYKVMKMRRPTGRGGANTADQQHYKSIHRHRPNMLLNGMWMTVTKIISAPARQSPSGRNSSVYGRVSSPLNRMMPPLERATISPGRSSNSVSRKNAYRARRRHHRHTVMAKPTSAAISARAAISMNKTLDASLRKIALNPSQGCAKKRVVSSGSGSSV